MRYTFYLLIAAFAIPVSAQPTFQTCDLGTVQATLAVNNVSACARPTGEFATCALSVPYQTEGVDAVLASGLWVGGEIGGEVRLAGSEYGPYDFSPGPIDGNGNAPADCSPYDRIWSVSRADIEAYENGGVPATDLAEWPAADGAPVIDGDGNPDNYDLAAGDRPNLQGGDATLWWILNDSGNFRRWADDTGAPMGIEVQMQAWALDDPSRSFLHNTTFYRATLRYQNTRPLVDATLGFWMDTDLGDFMDDWLGSDHDRSLAYVYNGDNNDVGGFGDRPAALGLTILDGLGSDEAYSVVYYDAFSGGPQGSPTNGPPGQEAYAYMNGFWRDGTPFTIGGDGYGDGTTPTRFVFDGMLPSTGWTESSAGNAPGDRLFVISTGPRTMNPGDTANVTFAIVSARADTPGANAHFDAANALLGEVDLLRAFYATPSERAPDAAGLALSNATPNPAGTRATVSITLQDSGPVRVEAFDALGRRVSVLHEGALASGAHVLSLDARALPAGLYIIRAISNEGSASTAVTLAR